jgi:peptide/nickel transport system substrate-binding protein
MTDSNNFSRRRFLQATGGAAGAAALAGCTGGGDDTSTATDTDGSGGEDTPTATNTPSDITKGGQLELINSTTSTFDPIRNTDTAGGRVIQNVFDMLMNYPYGQASVEKQLAESYETNDDFTQYTFTLKDATFHNGDPVRAQDFVYSWERLAASENSRRASFLLDFLGVTHETNDEGEYEPGTLGVSAEDDKTFVVEQNEPFASSLEMMAYTSFAAVPEGIVGDIEGYDGEMSHTEFATKNPVGAGPFVFDNWNQGEDMRITKYEDYHDEPAYLDSVHWKVIEDDNAIFQYVQNKNADAFGIPTARYDPQKADVQRTDDQGRQIGKYGPLQNGETVNYARVPELSTFYFAFNAATVPAPVRKAVAYAANQKQFAEEVFKNRVAPAYHFTPPLIYPGGGNAYTKHAKENYPYGYNEAQIGEAKKVMEDAGYGPDNKYELTFTHYVSDTWSQMAQILRDRVGAAHINMKIEQAQFSTLLERGRNGNLEAYTLGWIADYPAPDNFLQFFNPPQTDTSKSSPVAYTNWDDVDSEAKQKATQAWSVVQNNPQPSDAAQKKRNEAYVKLEEANWADAILINAFHGINEPMHYDWTHIPLHGAMGSSRMMHHRTWKDADAPTNN